MRKKIVSFVILFLLVASGRSFADWKIAGTTQSYRYYAGSAPLPDGRILIVGGVTEDSRGYLSTSNTVEVFDPSTGTSVGATNLFAKRNRPTVTPLPNGMILVAGTYYDSNSSDTEFEELFVYGPSPYFIKTGKMNYPRYSHNAVLLKNGNVLIIGGTLWESGGAIVKVTKYAEIFDPVSRNFSVVSQSITTPRADSASVLLKDGRVLITGGSDGSKALSTVEIFDPVQKTFEQAGFMNESRYYHTATLLPTGEVLIAGGYDGKNHKNTAEIYNPSTGAFTPVPNMKTARSFHKAILTENRKVLLVGGYNGSSNNATSEMFDPISDTFACLSDLNKERSGFVMEKVKKRIYVTGGSSQNKDTLVVETYVPGCN